MYFTRRSRRGANAIEFALTLPMFLLVTFGMMEFGSFFSQKALVNSVIGRACREAALIDPVNPPSEISGCGFGDGCIEFKGEDEMSTLAGNAGLVCSSCTATVSGAIPNRVVTCEMEVDYSDITGAFSAFFPTSFEATTTVRLEWQRL